MLPMGIVGIPGDRGQATHFYSILASYDGDLLSNTQ